MSRWLANTLQTLRQRALCSAASRNLGSLTLCDSSPVCHNSWARPHSLRFFSKGRENLRSQHPQTPTPPWVESRADLRKAEWKGRHHNRPEWVTERFERMNSDNKIQGWESFFGKKRKVTTHGANDLMRVFANRRQPHSSLQVFEEMKKRDVPYDEYSYNIAISASADMGDTQRAERLLMEYEQSEIRSQESDVPYAALMKAYMRAGDFKGAVAAMDKAKAAGIQPTKVMFTTLIMAQGYLRDIDAALMTLNDMRMAEEHPDAIAYNAILKVCAQCKAGYKAMDIWDEMLAYGIPVDAYSYNSVIKATAESGLIEDANKYFIEMMNAKAAGRTDIAPSKETFTIIIQHFANVADLGSAVKLVQTMVEQHNIQADQRVYGALIDCCSNAAALKENLEERQSFAMQAETILDEAWELFPTSSAADKERILSRALKAWTFTCDSEAVDKFMKRYQQHGLSPSRMAWANLLTMHERRANGADAEKGLKAMIDLGLDPGPSFVCTVALAYSREGDSENTLRVLREAKDRGIDVGSCKQWLYLQNSLGMVWTPPSTWRYPQGVVVMPEELTQYQAELEKIAPKPVSDIGYNSQPQQPTKHKNRGGKRGWKKALKKFRKG